MSEDVAAIPTACWWKLSPEYPYLTARARRNTPAPPPRLPHQSDASTASPCIMLLNLHFSVRSHYRHLLHCLAPRGPRTSVRAPAPYRSCPTPLPHIPTTTHTPDTVAVVAVCRSSPCCVHMPDALRLRVGRLRSLCHSVVWSHPRWSPSLLQLRRGSRTDMPTMTNSACCRAASLVLRHSQFRGLPPPCHIAGHEAAAPCRCLQLLQTIGSWRRHRLCHHSGVAPKDCATAHITPRRPASPNPLARSLAPPCLPPARRRAGSQIRPWGGVDSADGTPKEPLGSPGKSVGTA